MFTNRFFFISVIALALLAVVAFTVRAALDAQPGVLQDQAGSDYYQRHPEARIPVAGASEVANSINQASSDAQRAADTTDYFQRHPEARIPVAPLDLAGSDYFQRHPEFTAPPREVDTTDYYFRHPSSPTK